jgi:gliding motility-associated-like protein
VCGGGIGSASVTASGGTPGLKYLWNTGPTGVTAKNLISGNYTVTVTDANNCTVTVTTNVGSSGSVSADAGNNDSICAGKAAQLNASGGGTYSWSPAAGLSSTTVVNPIASPTVTTTYYVSVAAGSCTSKDSVTVKVNPVPLPDAGLDKTISTIKSVTLAATGGASYLWTPASNLSGINIANPTFGPAAVGIYTYKLIVTDSNGCAAVDSVTITVTELKCGDGAFLPTAFSPNGDGQNDMLYVRGDCIKKLTLLIYDRWGEKVFETTNPANGWDGKFRSKECDTAVYTYYLAADILDGTTISKKGNVTLLR